MEHGFTITSTVQTLRFTSIVDTIHHSVPGHSLRSPGGGQADSRGHNLTNPSGTQRAAQSDPAERRNTLPRLLDTHLTAARCHDGRCVGTVQREVDEGLSMCTSAARLVRIRRSFYTR